MLVVSTMPLRRVVASLRLCRESVIDHRLRLVHDRVQMFLSANAVGIELVDVFRSRGARRDPSASRTLLQAPDGRVLTGSPLDYSLALLPRNLSCATLLLAHPAHAVLLPVL